MYAGRSAAGWAGSRRQVLGALGQSGWSLGGLLRTGTRPHHSDQKLQVLLEETEARPGGGPAGTCPLPWPGGLKPRLLVWL